MRIRLIIIPLVIFALALIQTSFLNHFVLFNNYWFQICNLVTLFVLVHALFERRRARLSWAFAVWGGLLLDLYSNIFGVWVLSLLILVFVVKMILKRYVSIPAFW